MEKLLEAMSNAKVKVSFGLQKSHIDAIEKELQRWRDMPPLASFPEAEVNPIFMKHVWDRLGKELAWCPFTLCLYYFEYLEKSKKGTL